MWGDWLYHLMPRDGQDPGLEMVGIQETNTVNATEFGKLLFVVPMDHIFWVQNAFCKALPTAGSIANFAEVYYFLSGISGKFYLAGNYRGGAATLRYGTVHTHQIILPPNTKIYGQVNFNIADANNSLEAGIFGWLLPRGNVSGV